MPNPKITKIRRRLKVFRLKVFRLKVFPVKSHATRAQNGQLITGILSTDKVIVNEPSAVLLKRICLFLVGVFYVHRIDPYQTSCGRT